MEDGLVDDREDSSSRPPQLSILCLILLAWDFRHTHTRAEREDTEEEGAGSSSEPSGGGDMLRCLLGSPLELLRRRALQ